MKLSDVLIRCLMEEGVDTVFGYPGASVISIYESLRISQIHHVLVRQEQASVHSASGYARITNKAGVCVATSGPGATNLITGIATAYMDSIPIVIITGQVKSTLIGRDVFQEVDITGATQPFIKHSYLLKDPQQLPKIVKEAFYIAKTGRPGPVLIDIPMDLQEEQINYSYPKDIKIRGYKPTVNGHIGQIKRAIRLIKNSKKPLICAGGGVILSGAQYELEEFVQKSNIPLVHTLMGVGVMPTKLSLNFGMIGSHGFNHSNWAIRNADTILFIGVRKADRAIANAGKLNENTNIIHIDIDPAEIGKITSATVPVVGDAKNILKELLDLIEYTDTEDWKKEIKSKIQIKEEIHQDGFVNPKLVIRELSNLLDDNAVIVTDVGQNQLWTVRNMEMRGDRRVLCSGGFGTMGYSIPASIGASIGDKGKQVVSILGDGSFQMSLFELSTLKQEDVKPIIVLFNNSGLGLVREIQRNGDSKEYGVCLNYNPNFIQIAHAYGIDSKTINKKEDISSSIKEAIESNRPYLLEFIVSDNESTL
ncbi:biosynthetic-type acetolactate synthase large subunit [Romboutsia sp.]|uniref:biosynthetic-type acetolactate synthase large subunit n=1 Tax=Romboutsia sp. TaxID=1965302 RepID=UPI003F343149